jgi:F5/8 type C domain
MAPNDVALNPPDRLRPFRALWEWFWRNEALRTARALGSSDEVGRIAQDRARISAEVAQQVLDPPGPWRAGNAYHLAASLFIESIGWSLRALSLTAEAPAPTTFNGPPSAEELERLFGAHEALLLEVAAGQARVARLRRHALKREFETTERRPSEVEVDARTLAGVASRLLLSSPTPKDPVDALMVQRVVRVGSFGLLLIGLLVGALSLRDWLDNRRDISVGKPWVTSSTYETVCQSPQHHCNVDKGYFFHTREERNPWLEIDLQRVEQFSRVQVFNRQDCCADRVVPLVVEISKDHKKWQEVARRNDVFDVWKASFGDVSSRWVRFRVAGRSLLHLHDVRVLR